METSLVAAFRLAASRFGDSTALVAGDHRVTFRDLEQRVAAAAGHIATHAPGDVVGLLLPNSPAFAWTFLGALWAGKSVAVLPTLAPPPLLKVMATEARLQAVLTSAELAGHLADAGTATVDVGKFPARAGSVGEPRPRALDGAVLLYTSGTTGRPKAVALSDRNILSNIEGAVAAAGFDPADVILAILPFFHSFGLTVTLLLPLSLGATVVLLERFVPRMVLQAIEQQRVTVVTAVPSQYRLMIKESRQTDASSLRLCLSGAERLPEQVALEFETRFGQPLLQGYGSTETSPVIALNLPAANRPGSVGRPLPNLRVTIREDGRELPPGEIGEVWVEGPNVMLGYHNRLDATAEKIVGGALRTGDRGYVDADGFLFLVGRADELIKIAGEKIYPVEVEAALESVEGVEEAAVLTVPDEKHGLALCAFVHPRPGVQLTEAGVRAACRGCLEGIKVPRTILIVDPMPRTASGKVDKRALAAQLKT